MTYLDSGPALATSGADRSAYGGSMSEKELQLARLREEIQRQLVTNLDHTALDKLNPTELREQIQQGVEELCRLRRELLTAVERKRLVGEVLNEMLGFGPLEPLLSDPTISDILINGPRIAYVERAGQLVPVDLRFRDDAHLLQIIQRICARVGRRCDETNPMVDARLPDGSRFNAIIPPLALDGALVSIRRFGARPLAAANLIEKGSITPEMVDFLAACVRARMNILISGGTGSGKTTLLNLLSSYVPSDQRVATIEDAAELRLQQRHVVRMETRRPNLEGEGEVTQRDLLKNALRMRPDRIVIGECRGGEALDMLQAMNTGHDGSMTTLHANTPRDATMRLEMLVGMSGCDIPSRIIRPQIASAVQIIVQVARLTGGVRKITHISEVVGMEGDEIALRDIFSFKRQGLNRDGQAQGYFYCSGYVPRCLERLQESGEDLAAGFFASRLLSPPPISITAPATAAEPTLLPSVAG